MKGILDFARIVFVVLLASALTIFVVQNFGTIDITFLAWSGAAPNAFIVLSSVLVGAALGWLLRGGRSPKR